MSGIWEKYLSGSKYWIVWQKSKTKSKQQKYLIGEPDIEINRKILQNKYGKCVQKIEERSRK